MEFLKTMAWKKISLKTHLSFYGFMVSPFYNTTCIIGIILFGKPSWAILQIIKVIKVERNLIVWEQLAY